jgi:Uma2 family endonuclease
MATTKLLTFEDFELLDDDKKYEIIDGELYEVAPANPEHARIAYRIVAKVSQFDPELKLIEGFIADGPFRLVLETESVVVPDVAFMRVERMPPDAEIEKRVDQAPDIAVEIMSPSDRISVVMRKVMRYLEAGTLMVWLVDPAARTVTVYEPGGRAQVLDGDDHLDGGDIIPGFSVPVRSLFPQPR